MRLNKKNVSVFLAFIALALVAKCFRPVQSPCEFLNADDWEQKRFNPQAFIAHAGGEIGGIANTNSKEAVLNSISKGFRFIELDILETADNELVAAHDWKNFKGMSGDKMADDTPLTHEEFTKRRILGKLTPLDALGIREIFMKHPDLYLVTDKIDNFELIVKEFGDFRERIIVEVFSRKKYEKALKAGIKYPAYCVWNGPKNIDKAIKSGFRMITIPLQEIAEREEALQRAKANDICVLSFSYNTNEMMKQKSKLVTMYYTDYWNVSKGEADCENCNDY